MGLLSNHKHDYHSSVRCPECFPLHLRRSCMVPAQNPSSTLPGSQQSNPVHLILPHSLHLLLLRMTVQCTSMAA